MPCWSGASTSLMMLWYGPASATRACSIDTPGFNRPNRYRKYDRRLSNPLNGCENPIIVTGAKMAGLAPSVVPSKPRSATPTTVMVWPFTMIG